MTSVRKSRCPEDIQLRAFSNTSFTLSNTKGMQPLTQVTGTAGHLHHGLTLNAASAAGFRIPALAPFVAARLYLRCRRYSASLASFSSATWHRKDLSELRLH